METQSSVTVPTVLRTAPTLDGYIPLGEHQSRTPATFFGGPPVLHFHSTHARAYVSPEHQAKLPWSSAAAAPSDGEGALVWPRMGDDMVCQAVHVFVGSEALTLFSPDAGCGLALPYPVIGLHAIKTVETVDGRRVPTVYMQLGLDAGNGDGGGDEEETVELLLVLPLKAPSAEDTDANTTNGDAPPPEPASEASALFEAISACADLHPDCFGDDDDDDDDGSYPSFFRVENDDGDYEDGGYDEDGDDGILVDGTDGLQPIDGFQGVFRPGDRPAISTTAAATDLPPPMPGSGGWITAENAHEFFDEEGSWRGRGGSLGGGAGRVRGRDELEGEAAAAETDAAAEGAAPTTATTTAEDAGGGEANGGGEGSESKRVRTE